MEYKRYGSRKFVIAVLGILLSAIMLWFGKVTSSDFTSVLIWAVGLYGAANTAQKITSTGETQ